MIRFSCTACRRSYTASDGTCPRCSPFRQSFRTSAAVCGKCPAWTRGARCSGCVDLDRLCDTERVWTGEIDCPRGRQHAPSILPKPPTKRTPSRAFSPPLRPGRVGFLSVAHGTTGGVEVWHQTLVPRLSHVAGFVCLTPELARGDLSELGCPVATGRTAARQLARSCDVLIAWGVGASLGSILPARDRPRVISVCHGDGSSNWARAHMADMAPWTDHSVYLCPSAADHCHGPSTWIPNAPAPERITPTAAPAPVPRDGTPTLLTYSRIAPEKRLQVLVAAMRDLPDYRLVIAGPVAAWDRTYYQSLVDTAPPNVVLLPPAHPGDLLCHADAFLSASHSEGYGLAMAEAMLAGVPVIAHSTGFLEWAPHWARLVPDDATPRQWAAAIATDFRCKTDQRNRATAAQFGINTLPQFVRSWQRLIDES